MNRDDTTTVNSLGVWARFLARLVDIIVLGGGLFFLLLVIVYQVSPKNYYHLSSLLESYDLLLFVPLVFLELCLEIPLLKLFGTTLGKTIFGIRLSTNPRLSSLVSRSFKLSLHGLALGLPFASLMAAWIQFRFVRRKGSTSYDHDDVKFIQNKLGLFRYALMTVAFVGFLLFSSAYGYYMYALSQGGQYTADDAGFTAEFPLKPRRFVTAFNNGDLNVDVITYSAQLSLHEEYVVILRKYSKPIPEDKFEALSKVLLGQITKNGNWDVLLANFNQESVFPRYDFKVYNKETGLFREGRFFLGQPHGVHLVMVGYAKEKPAHQRFFESFGVIR